MLLWAAGGMGKTSLAGGLNELTIRYNSKPTAYIAIESGEGGGAATLRKKDIPLVLPQSLEELDKVLAGLEVDQSFGGVVLDSSSEMVKSFVKPVALRFPCRERGTGQMEVRRVGIPTRSDYQTMGEMTRQIFQRLVNMSSHPNPAIRKHVIVTATEKINSDDEGRVTMWGPDLPGAMAGGAVAMFQLVGTVQVKPTVVGGKRVMTRYLTTQGDGVKALKDRFGVFPPEVKIKNTEDPSDDGLTLADMWEKFWVPAIEGSEEPRSAV